MQSADEVNIRDSEKLNAKTRSVSSKYTVLFTGFAVMVLFVFLFLYLHRRTDTSDLSGLDLSQADINNRIAVLPFVNITRDSTVEFICDGITDELITTLSRFDVPKVIARTSVMRFKGTSKGIVEISHELRVGTVLEGSVQRAGNRLRISAQLVDAATEEHLWAQDYNRDFGDILAIQTSIADSVAAALKGQLFVETKEPPRQVVPSNSEAHSTYLKGRYFWNKRTYESIDTAIGYFERTLEIDPDYAKAYVGLADSYLQLGEWGLMPAHQAFARVDRNVLEALLFDEGLGEAHCTRAAAYHSLAWSWKRAEQEFRMAIALSPNYATAHQWFAEHLSTMRRHDEALAEIERARELDPLSLVINAVDGWLLFCAKKNDLAIEQLLRTSSVDSSFALTDVYLGRAYIAKSMFSKGLAVLNRSREKFPSDPTVLAALGYALARNGKTEAAKKVIEELDHASGQHYGLSNFKALIYAGLSENDLTLEWLEKAYQQHVPWLSWVNVDPAFDHLRAEARFAALIDKMSLSDGR